MMQLLLILLTISYTYATSIPPFIYISTSLSYDDAELYCKSKFGTDLATIKSMQDRWDTITIINGDASRIWTGLRNTREIGWFRFFESNTECPMPATGACVNFWRNDGKPRCIHKQHGSDNEDEDSGSEDDEQGFECTAFYLDENLIDNDVDCDTKLPFFCNQQYDYVFGSELPDPGDVYQLEDGAGYIKLSENVTYLHQSHTLQCVFEYDEDDNILEESFVEITKEMYGSTDIAMDSILLSTGPIFDLLPQSCTSVPAVKVIDVIELTNSVKLYVKEAALFEYIPEMDIDGTNYEVFGNGEEAPIKIPNPEEQFANNNITNGSFTISILACAVYDEDGFQIGTEDPVDGKCNGKTVIDDYAGLFGDGFNTNTTDRRRLWGWNPIKQAVNWIAKKATNVYNGVKKAVRVVVSLITGNIDERVFNSALYIDEKIQYQIGGKQKLMNRNKLDVIAIGAFKMQAGVRFIFNVYADLKAKYKILSLNPSFDYFKFVLGANNEFDAYVNLQIQGGVRINYKLFEKSSGPKIFWLGPVPVVINIHGDVSVGIDIKLDLVISQAVGYEPLFFRYGVEYIKGTGWRKISDSNFNFVPRKTFGGEVQDSLSCFKFTVEPYVALSVGVTFYELVDVWFRVTASFPTSMSWPSTCDSTASCDHSPHQLKFGISFSINMDIGLNVEAKKIGLSIVAKSWHIWDKNWPLAAVCTDLEIASLSNICCSSGVPIISTAAPECDMIYDYDILGSTSLTNNGGCPSKIPCHQVNGRVYKKSGQCYKSLDGCFNCLPYASNYPQSLQPVTCNPCDCNIDIYDFDILGSKSLVNRGGSCPNNIPCHQVVGRVYKKSGQCYKALDGCFNCLPYASNYPQSLQPISCNPCDCNIIYDYDILGSKSLVNNGGCPNNIPCHQVNGRVYKKSGQCYKALGGCEGCLYYPSNHPLGLQPIVCNPCDSRTAAANSEINNKLLLNSIISGDDDNNTFYSTDNNNKWYLGIGSVLVLVNICACLLMYCACVKPKVNRYKVGYNKVDMTDKEIVAADL